MKEAKNRNFFVHFNLLKRKISASSFSEEKEKIWKRWKIHKVNFFFWCSNGVSQIADTLVHCKVVKEWNEWKNAPKSSIFKPFLMLASNSFFSHSFEIDCLWMLFTKWSNTFNSFYSSQLDSFNNQPHWLLTQQRKLYLLICISNSFHKMFVIAGRRKRNFFTHKMMAMK